MATSVATLSAQRGAGAPATPPLVRENATEKISDHVYVIPDNSVSMVPNIGIIVGSRGTLVVDTGLGARNGQTVVREMQKVSKTPELYLATTHFHPEHDLGAGGFPPTTKMIRSQDQQKEIAEQGLATAERFKAFGQLNAELLEGAEFRKADISFDREHVVDLGGVRVRVSGDGLQPHARRYGLFRRARRRPLFRRRGDDGAAECGQRNRSPVARQHGCFRKTSAPADRARATGRWATPRSSPHTRRCCRRCKAGPVN